MVIGIEGLRAYSEPVDGPMRITGEAATRLWAVYQRYLDMPRSTERQGAALGVFQVPGGLGACVRDAMHRLLHLPDDRLMWKERMIEIPLKECT